MKNTRFCFYEVSIPIKEQSGGTLHQTFVHAVTLTKKRTSYTTQQVEEN
jgi:hypothetical protein